MIRFVFLIILSCSLGFNGYSNNLQIGPVTLVGQNIAGGYVYLNFSISWDNSWRVSTGPGNWDAVWLFAKFRLPNGTWNHAKLSIQSSEHQFPAQAAISTTVDGTGLFVYRSSDGTGSFSANNCLIRWNYQENGVNFNDIVDLNLYGIEMVYVPQGAYSLGAPSSGTSYFFNGNNSANPYPVTSESAITWGCSVSGTLCFTCCGANGGDRNNPVPANFPKGFAAFYCMKYEITQVQYADFLNTLTYAQQVSRTVNPPNSIAGTGALSGNNSRNGIDIQTPGIASSSPATYACNLDGDVNYNETNDGQFIACNFLSFMDLAAYLDWACLRPMTELEYEKACRGTASAVAGEFAWGTASHSTTPYTITNSGESAEAISSGYSASTSLGNRAYYTTMWSNVGGPLRVGIFASDLSNSGRVSSGASFYGIMELTGNVSERAVTAGNDVGRGFTGSNGDGILSANGHANVSNWPGLSAGEVTSSLGTGFRGGGWGDSYGKVSDRFLGAYVDDTRCDGCGGRGVRTAN